LPTRIDEEGKELAWRFKRAVSVQVLYYKKHNTAKKPCGFIKDFLELGLKRSPELADY
jgi:hypothetical protein